MKNITAEEVKTLINIFVKTDEFKLLSFGMALGGFLFALVLLFFRLTGGC